MNKTVFFFALFFASTAAFAQEAYKCTAAGTTVYQDRPCTGSMRRSESMPPKSIASPTRSTNEQPPAAPQPSLASKLEQDKEYINKRVKERNFEREKDGAAELLQRCESNVSSIHQQINQVAASAPTGAPLNVAGAMALQLDQQRRQTEIASLQSQATAKRAECDQLRQEYDRKYRK